MQPTKDPHRLKVKGWKKIFQANGQEKKLEKKYDANPGQQGPCVVAAMDKFTWTTEILWRKRDGMATL